MSELVIIATGEVVESMTAVEAERITSRIADKIDAIADNLEQVMPLIREALTRGAWSALGYDSPTAYVSDRFKGALSRLPREIRRPVAAELCAAGMSTRAIAPIVGVSARQAAYDAGAGVQSLHTSPDPEPESLDEYRARVLNEAEANGDTIKLTGPNSVARPGTVTGLDGKTYPRPAPKPVECPAPKPTSCTRTATERRRPITDDFADAVDNLDRRISALQKLVTDDRFPQNRDKVAVRNHSDLVRAIDALQRVADTLNQKES
ncbi:hypothetical protein M3G03_10235 [Aestuariimicrobium sp. p3-SID1156]|uniref:hypothetical protein n=1 Tax=Aestuariimicrobium sp. p3-SID1156 TaxID=2916038 RepID=UPI00223ACF07|nr:hypothetical protein [Aestuariimicrobium sp. p3-SID1156]MCT1459909.1 hypothetical protein [Aestuariimicrobium sp. p3-SID1156]